MSRILLQSQLDMAERGVAKVKMEVPSVAADPDPHVPPGGEEDVF